MFIITFFRYLYIYVVAEKIFVRLEAARAVLLDSEQRAQYDQWRSGGFKHVVSFSDWQGMQARIHSVSHCYSFRFVLECDY